jgi:DoxX-like family
LAVYIDGCIFEETAMSEMVLTSVNARRGGRKSLVTGRVLSGLAALFLTFDAGIKLVVGPGAVENTVALGYTPSVIVPLGVLQGILLALYLVPRTAVLGAVLWTGYLGGAVATHVRLDNPLFTHVLVPIYVAAFLWGGLWLRDWRARVMLAPPASPDLPGA